MIKKISSVRFFISLAVVLIAAMVIGTLIPQNQSPQKYQEIYSPKTYQILKTLGFVDLYHTPWFSLLLFLLGLNTLACIVTRITERSLRDVPWGIVISHAGFLTILLGGVVSGLAANRGILSLTIGESSHSVQRYTSGETFNLPFNITLSDFIVEYYDSGQHFIQVSDSAQGWKEAIEVQPGKSYVLRDNIQLKVVQYLPDFRMNVDSKTGIKTAFSASSNPNNPAMEVEIGVAPNRKKVWLFSKYPDFSFHVSKNSAKKTDENIQLQYQMAQGKIKQFRSQIEIMPLQAPHPPAAEPSSPHDPSGKAINPPHPIKMDHSSQQNDFKKPLAAAEVAVNRPFKYQGYNIYQSGYDPENPNFSSFQISKDPGVPIVYAGFIILPMGLFLSFYGRKST